MTRPTRIAMLLAVGIALWIVIATAVAAGYLAGMTLAASRPAQLAPSTTVTVSPPPSPDATGQDEAPDDHPGASATAAPVRPSRTPSPEPVPRAPARGPVLRGVATWFDSPAGVSAAGPALRAALGSGWRGRTVTVCAGERCVETVLGDWCACGDRPGGPTVIDLHAPIFAALAPLSRGVIAVTVQR